MTATGNPHLALETARKIIAFAPQNPVTANALSLIDEALRGTPYPAASLETAACAWEAVLEMENDGVARSATSEREAIGAQIQAARDALGSAGLRLTVLGWVDAIDAAWRKVDTDDGSQPRGGEYGRAFDWEFVPGWIVENIDWSDPRAPTVRKPLAAQAVETAPAAPREMVAGDIVELRTYQLDAALDGDLFGEDIIASSMAEAQRLAVARLNEAWREDWSSWDDMAECVDAVGLLEFPTIMAERISADELARLRSKAGELP